MNKWILSLAIPLTLAAASQASAADKAVQKFTLGHAGWVTVMSDNGKYGLSNPPSNSETDAFVYRLNVQEGTITKMPLNDEQADPNMGNIARNGDITDDGETIVGSFNGRPAIYHNGAWEALPMPPGSRSASGHCDGVTPDGKTIIGTIYFGMQDFKPLLWINGELQELGDLPTYQEMYDLGIIDKEDLKNHTDAGQSPNIQFFHISSDGKHIIAGTDHNYPGWGCARFVYHVETKTYDWIRNDQIKGINFVDDAFMSNNGKYVAGFASMVFGDLDGQYIEGNVPYTYDIEKKEFKLGEYGDPIASAVDNFGNYYYSSGEAPYYTFFVTTPTGLKVTVDRIIKSKYGVDLFEEGGVENSGYTVGISDDACTLLCQGDMVTNAYSLNLTEPLHASAMGVNLLDQPTVSPEANSAIARLRTVAVQLSYSSLYNDEVVPVIMEDGKEIAKATKVASAISNNTLYSITFDDIAFSPEKKYQLVVPAGAFYVDGTDFKTEEIKVDYAGREEKPLVASKISPESGSAIRELGLNNPIYFTFDTKLGLVQNAVGQLYEEGAESPLSTMLLAVNGNMLAAYPPSSRFLNAGKKFVVKIGEGLVTDLQGFCPNDEITLTYEGTYVPETSPIDGALFFDDFNDPNESLSKWLNYEGDHNTPYQSMVDLGFDADNTPWNFSTRDNTTTEDYYATSHSVYDPAGTSDDWMSTPRLSIVSPECYLTFKAQSYKNGMKDFLKVVVYEDNNSYGSIDKTIVDKMKSEGKVVFNEQLKVGATEDNCENEWTEYRISLADFANKNIYIAFVNENTSQSLVFVDDVMVKYDSNFVASSNTPSKVTGLDEVEISTNVRSNADTNYKKIEASLKDVDGVVIDTYSADIDLAKDQTYTFSFPNKAPLAKGQVNNFEVEIKLDNEAQNLSLAISNLTEAFQQNVLIEEGTGLWCQACPQGMIAFDYLTKAYPGQIIPVAIHQGQDRYAWDEYCDFLQFQAFPTGRVNRTQEQLFPMNGNSFVSAEGNNTWMDRVITEIAEPAEARISATQAYYVENTPYMDVEYSVDFAINKKGVYYNTYIIVLEDGLKGRQVNGLRENPDPIYDPWGATGELGIAAQQDPNGRVDIICDHVARGIAGSSFYGISGLIPTEVYAGNNYNGTIRFDVPTNISNPENASIVIALIDAGTGKIVNSNTFHGLTTKPDAVDEVYTAESNISFSSENGVIYANGDDNVEVFTIFGQRVANRGLDGMYVCRFKTAAGNYVSGKILVK